MISFVYGKRTEWLKKEFIDEETIDIDKEKFIEEYEKEIEVIGGIAPVLERRSDLRERVNTFYNAYYAKKLSEFTGYKIKDEFKPSRVVLLTKK